LRKRRTKKLHGLKSPIPQYPLIEITGTPDCGKRLIAQLIAKKIGGSVVCLPFLDYGSYTGRALIEIMSKNPKNLEKEKHWWFHMYAANIQEKRIEIANLLKIGPVVVTNYTTSCKIWARACSIDNMLGFHKDLPIVDIVFGLYGRKLKTPNNFEVEFSEELVEKITNIVRNRKEPKYIKVELNSSTRLWEELNRVSSVVSKQIKNRFKEIEIDESILYKPTLVIDRK
jgi:hypothetical protein